jgi:hypothetical protein
MITPDRVLINSDGMACVPNKAFVEFKISPNIAYLRKDGWSLGSPNHLKSVAYALYKDDWTHYTLDFETWVPFYKGV